jgi:hypothetical protein
LYLDDGVLEGRTADVAAALAVIAELGPDLVTNTLGPLSSLDDQQVVHMLIRLCASYCRVVRLLRAVPTLYAQQAIAVFDAAVQKALAHGVGVLFPEQARLQLCLPMAQGGAGMRRAAEHAAGAYLSMDHSFTPLPTTILRC